MGVVADVVGSWLGGEKQASGEKSARDLSYKAMQQALALQKDVYNQQRADQLPWLQQGGQAMNLLGQFYGFTPSNVPTTQSSVGTTTSTPTTGGTTGGATTPPNTAQTNFGNALYNAIYGRNTQSEFAADPANANVQTMQATATPTTQATSATPTTTPAQYQQQAMDRFFASPDYQFRLNEGNRNILGNAAATGGLQSGATLKALQTYGQNMASGEFGNYWNRLAGLAGVGQTAAGNVGQAGSNYASGSTGTIMQDAANRGTSYIRNGQNWANTIGGITGSIGSQATGNFIGNILGGF